jgi:HK97 family phage prohead protease
MSMERRYTRGDMEFRAGMPGTKSPGTIVGYALKFNTLSQNLGGFVERIAPGAVDKSVADGLDVLARYNHDDNMLLGRTSSGTVRLSVDEVGLMYEVDLPDTTAGRDLAVLAARADVHQSSFAFQTIMDSWDVTEQGFPLRTLEQIRLVDVAPVNTPAYLDTSSALRSLAEARALDVDVVAAAAAENRLADMLAAEEPAAEVEAEPASEHPLNERQRAQYEAIEAVVRAFGLYDQTSGPNGAHYIVENPFAADGLACASCAFYDGSRACEVVAGDIAPDAICKLWIIPSDLIGARSADADNEVSQVDNHETFGVLRHRLTMLRTSTT